MGRATKNEGEADFHLSDNTFGDHNARAHCHVGNLFQPIRITTQNWVVITSFISTEFLQLLLGRRFRGETQW